MQEQDATRTPWTGIPSTDQASTHNARLDRSVAPCCADLCLWTFSSTERPPPHTQHRNADLSPLTCRGARSLVVASCDVHLPDVGRMHPSKTANGQKIQSANWTLGANPRRGKRRVAEELSQRAQPKMPDASKRKCQAQASGKRVWLARGTIITARDPDTSKGHSANIHRRHMCGFRSAARRSFRPICGDARSPCAASTRGMRE